MKFLHYAYTEFGIAYWLYDDGFRIDNGTVETYAEFESYLHEHEVEFFKEVEW